MRTATNATLTRNLLILESRQAILALAPLLEALAARCGQAGAMHWLPYFLDKSVLGRRSPRLVLLLSPEDNQTRGLTVNDLEAAALFFEYEIVGIPTGVVATGDAVGFNTVIAPAGLRAQVSALAARSLLERGASVLLATHDGNSGQDFSRWMPSSFPVSTATRVRRVPRMLPLANTFDATLAQMGKSTRFNLRYYRRRLEKQMRCEFVANAAPLLRETNLQRLNEESLNPVSEAEFRRRVAAASDLHGSFLYGLRDERGQWLSLIGGWQQGETTVLYWQMNRAGLEKHSIGTVMRSYFLEHEITRGARSLLIYGGTPHSMRHSFATDDITDFVVERRGVRSLALRFTARTVAAVWPKIRRSFVLDTLCSPELKWHSGNRMGALPQAVPSLKSARAQRAA